MLLNEHELYQLLTNVYPKFIECLPKVVISNNRLSSVATKRNNNVTQLREELLRVGNAFKTIDDSSFDLSGDSVGHAECALEGILYCLENHVNSEAEEYDTYDDDRMYSKVEVLRDHPEEADLLVTFGSQPRDYKMIKKAAKNFSQFVEQTYVNTAADIEGELEEQPADRDSIGLKEALHLSDTTRQLIDALEMDACLHGLNRMAYLKLPDLEQDILDMLLSVCSGPGLWQQAYFHIHDRLTAGESPDRLCTELELSLRRKLPTTMALVRTANSSSLRKFSCRDYIDVAPPPTMTLRRVLEDENNDTRQKRASSQRILKRNVKRGIGVNIASTLFFLFACPLFQAHSWNLESIFIADTATHHTSAMPLPNVAHPSAYLSFCLDDRNTQKGELEQGHPPTGASSGNQVQEIVGNPLLLALAVMLLELEMENTIMASDEDIDYRTKQPSMYMAAVRSHREFVSGNTDGEFDRIIHRCLDLYVQTETIDQDDKETHRKLYLDVILPLTRWYKILIGGTQPSFHNSRLATLPSWTQQQRCPMPQNRQIHTSPQQLGAIQEDDSFFDRKTTTSTAILLASKQAQDSQNWLNDVDQINSLFLSQYTGRKVRIAILDTGCNPRAMCIANLRLNMSQLRRRWKDWVDGSIVPIDEDGGQHGTATAALLLRVAKHTDVYIARVTKDTAGLASAKSYIADAIAYAVNVWDVDIISMSFGFHDKDVAHIGNAIDEATTARTRAGRGILFFAAANNQGLNQKEMFPANHRDVIAIRGTDHMGRFLQEYNCDPYPDKEDQCRFGTLATDVPYDCLDDTQCKSGCSIATPIFAGFVAMVIQYMERCGDAGDPSGVLRRGIRERKGVIQVIKRLTDRPSNERYVSPWSFFELSEDMRLALVTMAIGSLSPPT